VNPPARRPLVAEAIAKLGENQRRMGAMLQSLLSRRNEEPSPAPSTSYAVEAAPLTATSETSTSGENVQGNSGPSPDWQRIAMCLAIGQVQPPPAVGATPRPQFTNSIRFLDYFQTFYAGVRSTPDKIYSRRREA
jgi:hypothetical protein